MRWLKRVLLFGLGLGCGVLGAVFMAMNTREVTVRSPLDGGAWEMPLWVLALCAFAAGALAPVLAAVLGGVETLLDRRRLTRRIRELEQELVELRNLPLTEARIDIDKPAPRIRPLVEENREVEVEVLAPAAGDIREADLYPAVYERSRREA